MKTKQIFSIVSLMFLVSFCVFAQREKSTLLPGSEATDVTDQCSRPGPKNFSAIWQPSQEEIREMEANFSKIEKLKAKKCCIEGERVENPEEFYMKYVGIIVNGKKLIYINAFNVYAIVDFAPNDGSQPQVTSDYWKRGAILACGDGKGWGALFNPKTKTFFDLAINAFEGG